MSLPDFQYIEPASIEEAADFVGREAGNCKILSGGTDLLPSMKQGLFKPNYLVYLGHLQALEGIHFDEESGLTIGSLVKLQRLLSDSAIVEKYPMVAQAAGAVGSTQLREMGTVGGNLCLNSRCVYYNQSEFWRGCLKKCIKMDGETCNALGSGKKCFAVFSGDLAPMLVALDAEVQILSSRGKSWLPLRDFYTGDGAKPLTIGSDELLIGVRVPALTVGTHGVYLKYRIRNSIDFPLASVATRLMFDRKQKLCLDARVVIGAVGTRPEEVEAISELLKGKEIGDSLIEESSELAIKAAKPIANTAGSPAYRKWMIKVLVRKALSLACDHNL
jgi:4-hydroxybenzoyl-CoA reductase subunit beta